MKKIIIFLIFLLVGVTVFIIKKYSVFLTSEKKEKHIKIPEKDIKSVFSKFEDEITEKTTIYSQNLVSTNPISFALEVKGNEEFKTKTKNAIRLLWLYDKEESFSMLRKYVFEIRQSNRTNFIFDNDKPIIELSDKMVRESSITFLASVIAHNAWHGWYLTQKKFKNKKKEIPHPSQDVIKKDFINPFEVDFKKYDDLFEIENQASNYQIKILEKLKAPSSEIYKIKNRQKNDFSNAHDGNFIVQY